MQTETKTHSRLEKTVKAPEFFRALASMASGLRAEMQNIKVTIVGDTITAVIDDAVLTITPRTAQEGGAA